MPLPAAVARFRGPTGGFPLSPLFWRPPRLPPRSLPPGCVLLTSSPLAPTRITATLTGCSDTLRSVPCFVVARRNHWYAPAILLRLRMPGNKKQRQEAFCCFRFAGAGRASEWAGRRHTLLRDRETRAPVRCDKCPLVGSLRGWPTKKRINYSLYCVNRANPREELQIPIFHGLARFSGHWFMYLAAIRPEGPKAGYRR